LACGHESERLRGAKTRLQYKAIPRRRGLTLAGAGHELMPLEPLRHTAFIGIGCAHFAAGRYDRAAVWARSGVDAFPGSFWGERLVVAAAVHAGARAEARRTARNLLRKDPELTVAVARRAWPFPPHFMARLADGLAIAGMPRA
jgi:predicted Zn-dependent protease